MDVGTHTIFVGEIVESEVLKDGEPMTYAYYHQVKKGTTPKTAPTFRGEEDKEKSSSPGFQCCHSVATFTNRKKVTPTEE